MRTWDVFYPDVLPEVLGCPEPIVDRHLQRAARRFFAETRAWRLQLDPITLRAGRDDYGLYYPTGAEAHRLEGAAIDGHDIGLDVVDGSTLGERMRGNSGPRRILSTDLRTVYVMPTPGGDAKLVIAASMKPTQDAEGIAEDAMADLYRDQIALGALATLMTMAKQPWTDIAAATVKEAMFKDAIGKVKKAVWKANTNTSPRHRGQFF